MATRRLTREQVEEFAGRLDRDVPLSIPQQAFLVRECLALMADELSFVPMNEREALLTGVVLGVLVEIVADPDTPFTYVHAEAVGGDFTNRIHVTADDGAVFMVTVEQAP